MSSMQEEFSALSSKESMMTRWEQLKHYVFKDERKTIPFWAFFGPAFLFFTTCLLLTYPIIRPIAFSFILLAGFILTFRYLLKGALIAGFVTCLFLSMCKGFTFWHVAGFTLSFFVSYAISALSLEEITSREKQFTDETQESLKELHLWKTRFQTLSEKYEAEKVNYEEEVDTLNRQMSDLQTQVSSLKDLVDISNHELDTLFTQNKTLQEEFENLKIRQVDIEQLKESEALAKSRLDQLNELRVSSHQMELFSPNRIEHSDELMFAKQQKQLNGDELLQTMSDMSQFAVDNYLRYKNAKRRPNPID